MKSILLNDPEACEILYKLMQLGYKKEDIITCFCELDDFIFNFKENTDEFLFEKIAKEKLDENNFFD